MKKLILLTLLIPFSHALGAEKIHSASNLEAGRLVVEIAGKERLLLLFDLASGKKEALPMPATTEEVMGTILLPGSLLLISQWTAGGGKPARLRELDLKNRRWAEARELDCLSFDQVSVRGDTLTVQCEADPSTGKKAKEVTVRISGRAKRELKLELPVSSGELDKFSFRLLGPVMAWGAIETKSPTGKSRVFKAPKLLAHE